MKRKNIFAILTGVIVLASALIGMFPSKALAAGEIYTWKTGSTFSLSSVTVTGGDVRGTTTLTYVPPSGVLNLPRNSYAGVVQHESGCFLKMTVTHTGAANLDFPPNNSTTVFADPAQGRTPACSQAIVRSYNGAQSFGTIITVKGTLPTAITGDGSGSGSGSGKEEETPTNPTCERAPGALSLSWVLCPVYNLVADGTDWIFSHAIQPLLRMKPVPTSGCSTSSAGNCEIYDIWSNFRVYGDIFLVIALLIIVFGQSIGGGMVEAYTARRALPRVLMAAILINLSIYFVAFAVDVTNIIGGGLGEIMTAPLAEKGNFNIELSLGEQAAIVGGTTGVIGGAALAGVLFTGALGSAAVFIGLFAILPMAIGILVAFFVLLLRQAIIILLVVASPVAFALWCLPNTEKYFKMWWDWLFRALVIYPIAIAIFALSDLMSVIIDL